MANVSKCLEIDLHTYIAIIAEQLKLVMLRRFWYRFVRLVVRSTVRGSVEHFVIDSIFTGEFKKDIN